MFTKPRIILSTFMIQAALLPACKPHQQQSEAKGFEVLQASGDVWLVYGSPSTNSLVGVRCSEPVPVDPAGIATRNVSQMLDLCKATKTTQVTFSSVKEQIELDLNLVDLDKLDAPQGVEQLLDRADGATQKTLDAELARITAVQKDIANLRQILKAMQSNGEVPADAPILARIKTAEAGLGDARSVAERRAAITELSQGITDFLAIAEDSRRIEVVQPYAKDARRQFYFWIADRFLLRNERFEPTLAYQTWQAKGIGTIEFYSSTTDVCAYSSEKSRWYCTDPRRHYDSLPVTATKVENRDSVTLRGKLIVGLEFTLCGSFVSDGWGCDRPLQYSGQTAGKTSAAVPTK